HAPALLFRLHPPLKQILLSNHLLFSLVRIDTFLKLPLSFSALSVSLLSNSISVLLSQFLCVDIPPRRHLSLSFPYQKSRSKSPIYCSHLVSVSFSYSLCPSTCVLPPAVLSVGNAQNPHVARTPTIISEISLRGAVRSVMMTMVKKPERQRLCFVSSILYSH
ncbi:unnamed protein product, partial [Prunus brigantina]